MKSNKDELILEPLKRVRNLLIEQKKDYDLQEVSLDCRAYSLCMLASKGLKDEEHARFSKEIARGKRKGTYGWEGNFTEGDQTKFFWPVHKFDPRMKWLDRRILRLNEGQEVVEMFNRLKETLIERKNAVKLQNPPYKFYGLCHLSDANGDFLLFRKCLDAYEHKGPFYDCNGDASKGNEFYWKPRSFKKRIKWIDKQIKFYSK